MSHKEMWRIYSNLDGFYAFSFDILYTYNKHIIENCTDVYLQLHCNRTGSTIVEHEIVSNNTATGNQQITQSVTSLSLTSAPSIVYNGQQLDFLAVQVVDSSGNQTSMYYTY
jgi:hypothetical protein